MFFSGFLHHPDYLESRPQVHRRAQLVFGSDSREQAVMPEFDGARYDGPEEGSSDSSARRGGVDVDG